MVILNFMESNKVSPSLHQQLNQVSKNKSPKHNFKVHRKKLCAMILICYRQNGIFQIYFYYTPNLCHHQSRRPQPHLHQASALVHVVLGD